MKSLHSRRTKYILQLKIKSLLQSLQGEFCNFVLMLSILSSYDKKLVYLLLENNTCLHSLTAYNKLSW